MSKGLNIHILILKDKFRHPLNLLKVWAILFIMSLSQQGLASLSCHSLFSKSPSIKYPAYNLTHRLKDLLKENNNNGVYSVRKGDRWITTPSGTPVRFEILHPIGSKTKETLLFFGGLGYEVERFWHNSSFFNTLRNQGFKIVYIELPGQGETLIRERIETFNKKIFSYDIESQKQVIEEALAILKQKKILPKDQPYHMSGLSYGGWFLTYLAQFPQLSNQMKSLTLIATGVKSLHKNSPWPQRFLVDSWSWMLGHIESYQRYSVDLLSHYINNELPHLKKDPLKVHGSASLTLGIYKEDAIINLKNSPRDLSIQLLLASADEVVPGNMHWDLARFVAQRSPRNKIMVATPSTHDIVSESQFLGQNGISELLTRSNIAPWTVMSPHHSGPIPVTPDTVRKLLKNEY